MIRKWDIYNLGDLRALKSTVGKRYVEIAQCQVVGIGSHYLRTFNVRKKIAVGSNMPNFLAVCLFHGKQPQ